MFFINRHCIFIDFSLFFIGFSLIYSNTVLNFLLIFVLNQWFFYWTNGFLLIFYWSSILHCTVLYCTSLCCTVLWHSAVAHNTVGKVRFLLIFRNQSWVKVRPIFRVKVGQSWVFAVFGKSKLGKKPNFNGFRRN